MVAKGYWVLQPDNPLIYPNVPASSGHRQDIATYAHYLFGVPESHFAGPQYDFPLWDQAAQRDWFALALWSALDNHLGADRVP